MVKKNFFQGHKIMEHKISNDNDNFIQRFIS